MNESKITVFLTWDAHSIHKAPLTPSLIHSLTHTKEMKWKRKIFAQLKQNTNNELRYYSLFSGNWHNIFFFCYYFSSFSHHHCAFMTELSTTNDVLFTLTSSNIAILTILTFDIFFFFFSFSSSPSFLGCHFIRISNLMNITLCHLYCKWILYFFLR